MRQLKEVIARLQRNSAKELYSVSFEANQDIGNLVRRIPIKKDGLTLKQAQQFVKKYHMRVGYYMKNLTVVRKSDNKTRYFRPVGDFFDIKTDAEFLVEKTADLQTDKVSEQDVIDWFEKHPDPDDDDVHAWAEELGVDPHELEEVIYSVLTEKL